MSEERVERRLAAIVGTDVVGYSRLMGADEVGTLAALKAHRAELVDPTLEQFGGRIVKTTGDGMLVEFSSVVDAVEASIAVQRGIAARNAPIPEDRRITFRIGVNIGDIIIDGDDIYGDGVNVAARLEALAEPGGICLSRAARDQVRDRLDVGLEDMGEVEVKNIARPVRVFRVLTDSDTATTPMNQAPPYRRWPTFAAASIFLALIGGAILWWWQPWIERVDAARPDRFAHALPDKPSIAILPFDNLSGDPEQEYFADGFTEDLITNVAQSKELFVISRNSTFTYKGRSVKIQQVAEELGVRYVLEGSVRRIGENMRIAAQLIDATGGTHIWAKRYDEPIGKLFDVQDELSQEIAGRLLANIRAADLAKASQKRPKDLSAYDYVLQARARWDVPNKNAKLEARALAEQAIAIDPNYAPAYAVLGDTFNSAYIRQWEGPEALDHAYQAARKAVELDPISSTAHELLGRVFLRRGQHDDAVVAIERSIALNPNRSRHYGSLADALTFANRPEEAIELLKKAMRLDPFYPPRHNMYLGRAYFFSQQYDKALTELKTCAARAPRYRPCYMYLAPTYAALGQMADAERTVATLLEMAPKFSITTSVEKHLPFVPSAMQFYIDGLRKAGVPERPPLELPDKPSIAVLPFQNLSRDPEQEYFADGMAEDIITDLSKVSDIFVVARNSTFTYKGKPVNVRQVAQDLGVRYVLEGSVRRAGDNVRITSQLTDVIKGKHLWSERYDRDVSDVFAIQSEVTEQVVKAMAVTLKANELDRLFQKHAANIDAYDAFVRARRMVDPPGKDSIAIAQKLFQRAIELDPDFAGGYAGLSFSYSSKARLRLGPSPEEDAKRSLEFAKKAIQVDRNFAWSHIALGGAHLANSDSDAAVEAVKEAIRLQPNGYEENLFYGFYLTFAGQSALAVKHLERAQRISPVESVRGLAFLSNAYFMNGEYAKSEALRKRRIEKFPVRNPNPYIWLAATQSLLGKTKDAAETAEKLRGMRPEFRLSMWRYFDTFKSEEHRKRLYDAAIKAGIPE